MRSESRYKIWELGSPTPTGRDDDPQDSQSNDAATSRKPIKNTRALTDLETSLLLYNYAIPIHVALSGVCTTPNGQSLKCRTNRISAECIDMTIDGAHGGRSRRQQDIVAGTALQINLDEIGPIGGVVKTQHRNSFEMEVDAADRGTLSSKLADIAMRRDIPIGVPAHARRTSDRVFPDHKSCRYLDHTKTLRNATVVSITCSEVLIRAVVVPPLKARIVFLGPISPAAHVVSAFVMGFVACFEQPIRARELSSSIRLTDL